MAKRPRPPATSRKAATVWFWSFWVVLAICLVIYALNILLSEISSGNVWGLSYGIAATVLMVGAAWFGLRRRTMKWSSKLRLGASRTWLYFHIYGGLLFMLLVFMHSGFRFPTGTLTWWLWLLSLWTTLSGLAGLALQKWIPRVLASGLAVEVLYDRIPALIDEIRKKAEVLVNSCDEPVRALYQRNVAPALAGPSRRLIYYLDITGGIRARLQGFEHLRHYLPAEEKTKLNQLEQLYKTKLEIDAHYTLQHALRWWLYLHVPTALLLLAFVALHIFAVLYY